MRPKPHLPSRILDVAFSLVALVGAASLGAGACSATGSHTFNTSSGVGGSGAASGSGAATSSTGTPSGGGGGGIMFDGGGVGSGGGMTTTGVDPTTCPEAAMYKTYIGCDFWPTVVANNVWSIFDYTVVVANAGTETAGITVSRGGQTVGTYTVAPNSLTPIYLPWVPELKGGDFDSCGDASPLSASVLSKGGAYHLVTTFPVTVYQFNALEYQGMGGAPGKDWSSCPGDQVCMNPQNPGYGAKTGCYSFSNDASLLLPSTAMTGNYRITAPATAGGLGAYIAVTATQDNTSVTVYMPPKGNILAGGGIPAVAGGGQTTFTLNAGDVAELVGNPKTTSDHAGGLVHASAPVQVISGIPCADVPALAAACDHLEQTIFPAETLGKHYFVTVPTAPRGNVIGHVVRMVGNSAGTNLTYPSGSPPPGAPLTLTAGQVVNLGIVKEDFEVEGDHEFAVVEFMLGGSLLDPKAKVGMQLGDPSQSNTVAVEQYRVKYVFLAPTDYTVSYVDIVMPMGADVKLDGQPISAAPTPISSGFGIARQTLGPGNAGAHVLTSTAPVGIQVIGYGNYTSYQYPGGLNLGAIAPPPPPPT